MREYLAQFKKVIIRVVPPNQKLFMGKFQNGLKEGHFKEPFSQKHTLSLAKVVTKAEYYIKGEEINTKKKV